MTRDEYERWLSMKAAECETDADHLDGHARDMLRGQALAYRIALYRLPKAFDESTGASESEFSRLRNTARELSERQSVLVRERDEALSMRDNLSLELTKAHAECEEWRVQVVKLMDARDHALHQVDEVSKVRDNLSILLAKVEVESTRLRNINSCISDSLEKLFQKIAASRIGLDGVSRGIGRILGKDEP